MLKYERTSRDRNLKLRNDFQSCTDVQRGTILKWFLLQSRGLILIFFKKYNHPYFKLKSRKNNIRVHEWKSRRKWWYLSIFTQSCTDVQRESIFRWFLLQNRDLTLYFFSCIDTYYVRIRQNEIELVSKCLNSMNFGRCLASSNSIVKYVHMLSGHI